MFEGVRLNTRSNKVLGQKIIYCLPDFLITFDRLEKKSCKILRL